MKWEIVLGVTTVLLLILGPLALACISPQDPFSAEVLLNNPGVSYDLEMLKNSTNVVDVDPQIIGVSGEVLVYRSHYLKELRVILYESGLADREGKYFSVRLTPEMEEIEREGIMLPSPTFNFTDSGAKEAVEEELKWLKSRGIVEGLAESDIREIRDVTRVGRAGHNSRIFYEEGEWLPYMESENPMLLKAEGTCSFSMEGIKIPERSPSMPERKGGEEMSRFWWLAGIGVAVGAVVFFYRRM